MQGGKFMRKLLSILFLALVLVAPTSSQSFDSDLGPWYPFNETSTGAVTDHSPLGLNAQTGGGVTTGVTGVFGNTAFGFDGSDDYVRTNSNLTFSSHSVVAHVKTTSSENFAGIVSNYQLESGFNQDQINFVLDDAGFLKLQIYDGNSNELRIIGNTTINDGEYHNVGYTLDSSTNNVELYVDGVKQDLTVDTDQSPDFTEWDTALQIGVERSNSVYLNGDIDEPQFYNRSLSDSEMQTLDSQATLNYNYSSNSDSSGDDSASSGGLGEVHFALNDSDTSIKDYLGDDNSGTLKGSYSLGADGKFGKAVNFSDARVEFSAVSELNSPTSSAHVVVSTRDNSVKQTVWSAWEEDGSDGGQRALIELDDTDSDGVVEPKCVIKIGSTFHELTPTDNIQENKFYGVSYTYNGPDFKCFLNGEVVDSTSVSGDLNPSTDDRQVGAITYQDNNPVNGTIDEIWVNNQSWTDNQIESLWNDNDLQTTYSPNYTDIETKYFNGTCLNCSFYEMGVKRQGPEVLNASDASRFNGIEEFQHFSTTGPLYSTDPSIENGTWYGTVFTQATDSGTKYNIHLAKSDNGTYWEKVMLLYAGSGEDQPQDWMGWGYHRPQVQWNGTHFVLPFNAQGTDGGDSDIGIAINSGNFSERSDWNLPSYNPVITELGNGETNVADVEWQHFDTPYLGNDLWVGAAKFSANADKRFMLYGNQWDNLKDANSGNPFLDMIDSDGGTDVDMWPGRHIRDQDGVGHDFIGVTTRNNGGVDNPAWGTPFTASSLNGTASFPNTNFQIIPPNQSIDHGQTFEFWPVDMGDQYRMYYTIHDRVNGVEQHFKSIVYSNLYKDVLTSKDRYSFSYDNQSDTWSFNSTDREKGSGSYEVSLTGTNVEAELKTASTQSGLDSASYSLVSDGSTYRIRCIRLYRFNASKHYR